MENETICFLEGKVDRRGREPNLIVGDLIPLDQAEKKYAEQVAIKFDTKWHNEATVDQARNLIKQFPGKCTVAFVVDTNDDGKPVRVTLSVPSNVKVSADPRLRDRPVQVRCVAIGGFKQPQMLGALAYLMSLGQRYDVVVELDGFNDVVLGYTEYKHKGKFPGYPRDWDALVGDYGRIRALIERTIPGFERYNERIREPNGFVLPHSAARREWRHGSGSRGIRGEAIALGTLQGFFDQAHVSNSSGFPGVLKSAAAGTRNRCGTSGQRRRPPASRRTRWRSGMRNCASRPGVPRDGRSTPCPAPAGA